MFYKSRSLGSANQLHRLAHTLLEALVRVISQADSLALVLNLNLANRIASSTRCDIAVLSALGSEGLFASRDTRLLQPIGTTRPTFGLGQIHTNLTATSFGSQNAIVRALVPLARAACFGACFTLAGMAVVSARLNKLAALDHGTCGDRLRLAPLVARFCQASHAATAATLRHASRALALTILGHLLGAHVGARALRAGHA